MTVLAFSNPRDLPAGTVLIAGVNAAGQAQAFACDANGNLEVTGGSGGGVSGANGAAGSTGSTAQYVQGIPGGTPQAVVDSNSAAFQGVVALSPGGAAVTAGRGLVFLCTTPGTLTLTLANGSTMAFPIAASASLQTLGFAVTNVALSGGAAGTFWGCV